MERIALDQTAQTAFRRRVKGLMRNTKYCIFFARGMCKAGGNCSFAHAYADVVPIPSVVHKTKLCEMFAAGTCKRDDCTFAHGEAELNDRFYKTVLCKQNKKGRCPMGSSCHFAHSLKERRALPPAVESQVGHVKQPALPKEEAIKDELYQDESDVSSTCSTKTPSQHYCSAEDVPAPFFVSMDDQAERFVRAAAALEKLIYLDTCDDRVIMTID